MKKMKRRTAAGITVMLVLAMALGGCGVAADEGAETEESAVTVSTQVVGTGTITLTNSFMGTISPEETVMVIPLAVGTVTETFFEVGDTVEAGDVLFKIDDEAAQLGLEQAELSAKTARQSADSTMDSMYNQQDSTDLQLEGSHLSSQSSFEQAQIGYVSAKDAYENLDKQYNEAKKLLDAISAAPSAGGNMNVNIGSTVSDNDISKLVEQLVQGELAKQEKKSDLEKLQESVASLKSARDQAYTAYQQASSGYRAADEGLKLTEKTETLTKDQLQQTVDNTAASMGTSISMAQLGVEQAQMALDNYTVKAPVSGVIESKGVEVNGIASQSAPAYTIVNNNTMTVTFQVSEAVKNTLSVGQQISLERNDDTYTASITEIGTSVNPQSGLFQVKACVAANGTELPNGISVKVNADTYRAENAMIIPYEAVYYENEGAYVYTSVNGRAVKTPITTGIFDDVNIVVTGGLELGDTVVTSWSPKLTGGVLLHEIVEDASADTKKSGAE